MSRTGLPGSVSTGTELRVAFHAINGVGLGHLVRAVSLAVEMRALVPGVQLLVLTNARDTTLLTNAGLDFVQLPPRLNEPHADPERVRTALPEPLEEAALIAALETFSPDLVVFDTHAPARVAQHVATLGARAVLVLRELRSDALRSFAGNQVALSFDRIVVPHEPGDIELSLLADLPVTLVGPIVRPIAKAAVRSASDPLVVATAGGGGQPIDARRYVQAVADAHLLARARFSTLETILVTGPYGEVPRNASAYHGLTVMRSCPDVGALVAKATLVVSQAGYNAIAEIRSLEKPAILVPGYRKAEDQKARAMRLVRRKAAVLAKPEARAIADEIEALLGNEAALASMTEAHRQAPLVPKNREAAEAVLRSVWRAPRTVERTNGLTAQRVKKVAIVAHDFAPKLGGMESVARALATSLIARGIEVRVYTANRLGARSASGLGDGVVEPLYPPLPPPARIDLESDLLATIDAALRDSPDVIHLCHAGLGPWIPALRAALPCVVTANVHGNDLLVPWVFHAGTPESYRAAQIEGLSAADAVLCVSRFSSELARGKGVNPAVLHTIENGVDPARFCRGPRDAELAHRLGLAEGDDLVLTVSRLAPRKGHRTVLQAVALLAKKRPRLKFAFTGASDAMRAELAQLAGELGIASRVVATGFLPDAELPALYRLADVFALLASDADDDVEGFGIALLEAAATGLPTIASRTGGVPEAIVDGETGILVTPGDAADAARALERILDDQSLARRLGERGRERVVRQLSHDRAVERILEIWSAILGRGPRCVAELPASADASLFPVALPATNGVEIVRRAQQHGARRRAERSARKASLRTVIERGQLVRLRATGDGARLLPDAIADCASLGHAPRVELKLRRFIEADFAAHALPLLEGVELAHGIPHHGKDVLLASLRAMPDDALARVRVVRLFLTPEARETPALSVGAVPEVHALRRFFSARGVTVVPPPELMRYLSELPAGGPETGMVEPTNLCNLACPTCPTGTGKIKPLPQMSLDRFDRVLGELAPRMRNLALWNYGEPLLNRELPSMIAHAKKAGVGVVKVSSNVHFLDGERGLSLLRSGLDVLILSVDGASQDTYATFRKDGDFERVAKSVAWLCTEKKRLGLEKPRIELQFIVMRHNEHELPEMRRLAREWGVDRLRVKTVGADDVESKDLVPTTRLLSRYKADGETPNVRHAFCTMAWDHTVVNVDGSVTPCCYLRPDMGEAFVMGNVFESSFQEIWRGERYRAFRASMLAGRDSMPVCNRCRGGTHDLLAAVEAV
jgi:radical SAM protein with 4Fe4S-binding SPASM domain